MSYSFSTVFNAVIVCNLLILVLAFILSNKKILIMTGYRILLFFLLIILVRMFLPSSFLFTKNIILPSELSRILGKVHTTVKIINGTKISLWHVLLGVWLVGIIIGLVIQVKNDRKIKKRLFSHAVDLTNDTSITSVIERVYKEKNPKKSFRIFSVDNLSSPVIFGFHNPVICIPDNLFSHMREGFTEDELYYIFSHEISHYMFHDLLIRQIVTCLRLIYWWNPSCHILCRQTDVVLEMRVDNSLTNPDSDCRLAYLNCLLKVAKQAQNTEYSLPAAAFVKKNSLLITRFQYLINEKSVKKNKVLRLCLITLGIGLFIFSYSYMLEISYIPKDISEPSHAIEQSMYFIRNSESFDLYYNNKYMETVDSLEYISDDIPVYNSKEEVN